MKSFVESIEEMDKRYRERTDGITMDDRSKKGGRKKEAHNCGPCWVRGCERSAESIGLCRYHRVRHYAGTLLPMSPSAFPVDEMFSLYADIYRFADEAGITAGEAIVWLAAEGINSYERRKKQETREA